MISLLFNRPLILRYCVEFAQLSMLPVPVSDPHLGQKLHFRRPSTTALAGIQEAPAMSCATYC